MMRPLPNFIAGIFCLFFCLNNIAAQTRNISDELKFVQYLNDKQLYKEAVYVLKQQDTTKLSYDQKDSLFYQLGWMLYNEKQLEESGSYLLRVSAQSSYYMKARNFAAYNLSYLNRLDDAATIYKSINTGDSVLRELEQFELSGIALLKRDYKQYGEIEQQFTYRSYAFAAQEKKFHDYYRKLSEYKRKSPFLAGAYSAIIPGLGKIYAGKKKQGIGAFLPVASFGLLAYEAYRKDGIKSARFITFGSLFTVFYVANIWGSVVSVKVTRNEFYQKYDNKILFDLHIPLRSIFY
jgi:hypothetical protein